MSGRAASCDAAKPAAARSTVWPLRSQAYDDTKSCAARSLGAWGAHASTDHPLPPFSRTLHPVITVPDPPSSPLALTSRLQPSVQVPELQLPLSQSDPKPQSRVARQRGHTEPPQLTSLSSPPREPSKHDDG